jgi:hypothetical protein
MVCGGANRVHKATLYAEDHSATLISCIILHTFFGIDNGLCPQDRGETHRGCGVACSLQDTWPRLGCRFFI